MSETGLYDMPCGSLPEHDDGYRLALGHIERQEFEKALAILDPLAGPSCRDPRLRYARAVALLSIGEFRRAGTDLVFTIALNPAFLPAYRHLGFVLLTMAREEQAVKVLEKALAIDPAYTDAWCVLGDVWLDLVEPEKAKAAFDRALELEPGMAEPHCKLAMYYLSRGDMRGLRAEYEILKELDPGLAAQIAELLP